jgi:hypothetical protein
LDENSEFSSTKSISSSTTKFPIETYQGLDEATAKRIKQFEDETKAMMSRNLMEISRTSGSKQGSCGT